MFFCVFCHFLLIIRCNFHHRSSSWTFSFICNVDRKMGIVDRYTLGLRPDPTFVQCCGVIIGLEMIKMVSRDNNTHWQFKNPIIYHSSYIIEDTRGKFGFPKNIWSVYNDPSFLNNFNRSTTVVCSCKKFEPPLISRERHVTLKLRWSC